LRDIKVRYKQTSLGIAWALVPPVLMTAIFPLPGRAARVPSEGRIPMDSARHCSSGRSTGQRPRSLWALRGVSFGDDLMKIVRFEEPSFSSNETVTSAR
jgi:hypothetical protein